MPLLGYVGMRICGVMFEQQQKSKKRKKVVCSSSTDLCDNKA